MAENGMEDDLTPEERAAFEGLARERMPGRMLEERTVRALRERGLLQGASPRQRLPRSWIAAAVAASMAVFASGVAMGQWLGTKQTTDALASLHSAAQIQRAGSDYVTAVTLLAERADSANPAMLRQGREVAIAALWAAANEIVRLAPDDPLVSEILQGFERAREQQSQAPQGDTRRVVWF